jgi:hypothetical protein
MQFSCTLWMAVSPPATKATTHDGLFDLILGRMSIPIVGYYNQEVTPHFSLSDRSILVVAGYTTSNNILALFAALVVLAPLPWILAMRRLDGHMPVGGTNSLVISAACHCSSSAPIIAAQHSSDSAGDDSGMQY